MSAIWGAISLDNKQISLETAKIMKDAFKECVIDRYEEVLSDNVYMGCGIQYVTGEAEREKLPKCEGELYFTADVVLDNREFIQKEIPEQVTADMPDGEMLFQILKFQIRKQQIEKCLNDLLGAYVFVWYDKATNQIMMVNDALGNRFVYYLLQDNILYFSSLMAPLERLIEKMEINERWIADFLAQDNLSIFTECEETTIRNIYRLAPAQMVMVSQKGIQKKIYWKPEIKPGSLKLRTEEEYKEKFVELYRECVRCTLRSPEETGIFLSGGYDSSSVAALAAPELEKVGKKLLSFTSVPSKEFSLEGGKKVILDETEAVREIQAMYPNIETVFMELQDMNAWYDRTDYWKRMELPYKSPQNPLWMQRGMMLAQQKNVRIMLGGMTGNATVSYGNLPLYLVHLFRRGHWVQLYREIHTLYRKKNFSRKGMVFITIKRGLQRYPYKVSKEELFQYSYANREYLHKWGADKRAFRNNQRMLRSMNDYWLARELLFEPELFRHDGEFYQKDSLYTGVLVRDPTKDKRMIEFTLNIPFGLTNQDAVSRRLIAVYMKELIPECILSDKRKGIQSADLKERLLKYEADILAEWRSIYEKNLDNPRVDCAKALDSLKGKSLRDMERFDIIRHIYTIILLEYINYKVNEK